MIRVYYFFITSVLIISINWASNIKFTCEKNDEEARICVAHTDACYITPLAFGAISHVTFVQLPRDRALRRYFLMSMRLLAKEYVTKIAENV